MALVLQAATFIYQYIYSHLLSRPSKSPEALRLGVLSTAQINPSEIIHPTASHPDVILYAIASSHASTAEKAAKQYRFSTWYKSYDDLLDDPVVNIVYVSMPSGLHHEWATKALRKGKHVLCEKPLTSNGEEARKLVQESKERGLVLEEAFHWQFHPAAHTLRQILDSRQYGKILRTEAVMTVTPGVPGRDIRWNFDLAGGSAMDMAYALSFTRFALHATYPRVVTSVSVRPSKDDPRVDQAMYAHLVFEGPEGNDVNSRIYTDMARSWMWGVVPRVWELPSIEVETEKAIIFFYNAMMPHLYHYIAITEKGTGKTQYRKRYVGGPLWGNIKTTMGQGGNAHWSTYRYQLEAFVDAVKEKTPAYWISGEDSIWQMESIDAMYRAAGLPVRRSNVSKNS